MKTDIGAGGLLSSRFSVDFSYKVYFTKKVFSRRNSFLSDFMHQCNYDGAPAKIVFALDQRLLNSYPELPGDIEDTCAALGDSLLLLAPPQIIQGGEALKSLDVVKQICGFLSECGVCRHTYIGIIGGGAFLDAVGFAASLVHRGIRQIRFPTTVMSQCDSGVGVKTGINMFGQKNFLGTFFPPYAVINDASFLDTLPYRDWISGVPEAFKVAMIKDQELFYWLIENAANFAKRDTRAMRKLVKRCAELHVEHIATSGDPFEFRSARPLDFGHWAAHKLEMMTGGALRHGESVGIGLLLDTYYSVKKEFINNDILAELIQAFKIMHLPLFHPELTRTLPEGGLVIFDGLEEFRVHLGGELHITLPDGLGCSQEVGEMDVEVLSEGIAFLRNL